MSQAGIFLFSLLPPGSVVESLTGNTGGAVLPDISNNINVVGDGTTITVAGDPGTSTLTISVIGGDASSFPTDSGTATQSGGVLNIIANTATLNSGSSVSFTGSGNTVQFNVTDISANTIIGQDAGNLTITGSGNTAFGASAASSLSSGANNTMIGPNAGLSLSSGSSNTIIGAGSGISLGTGATNTIIGTQSGNSLLSGSTNTLVGYLSGAQYNGSESNNITINSEGIIGESNTLRLGSGTGSGSSQLNQTFICGIDGINVGSTANVVTEMSDQLGTAILTAGRGIAITPTANVITIASTGIFFTYIDVTTSPYVVVDEDVYLSVDSSGGPITILFPDVALTGEPFYVKDRTGNAAVNNITVTTISGIVTIDGVTNFIIDSAYQAISLVGNGSTYEIF